MQESLREEGTCIGKRLREGVGEDGVRQGFRERKKPKKVLRKGQDKKLFARNIGKHDPEGRELPICQLKKKDEGFKKRESLRPEKLKNHRRSKIGEGKKNKWRTRKKTSERKRLRT